MTEKALSLLSKSGSQTKSKSDEMGFEWHTKKAERNLKNHGVSFEDAATVFDDPFAEFLPDLQHSEEEARYICLGVSAAGRFVHRARGRCSHY